MRIAGLKYHPALHKEGEQATLIKLQITEQGILHQRAVCAFHLIASLPGVLCSFVTVDVERHHAFYKRRITSDFWQYERRRGKYRLLRLDQSITGVLPIRLTGP